MTAALAAGVRYFLIAFAIGFALGTVRTLFVAPRFGDLAAVAIELPLMLAAAWLVCGRLVRRLPPGITPRAVMGGSAFVLLMVTEFAMSLWLFGRSPATYAAGLLNAAGLLGLAGQVAFALIPLVVRRS
jgi:ABC-type uncharacterized transport system permease subunit